SARRVAKDAPEEKPLPPEWRGWICIIASCVGFVAIAKWGGFVPATFAITFISAMGDRENTVKEATLLSLAMVVICIVVFWWALKMPFQLFAWEPHDRAVAGRPAEGLRRRPAAAQPAVVLRGRAGGEPHRRAARIGCPLGDLDPPAAHLHDAPDPGDPDARRHLLRLPVRRRDRRDPAEPAVPSAARGDLPRRLPDDQGGQGRHG